MSFCFLLQHFLLFSRVSPLLSPLSSQYWVHASLTEQSFAQLQERNLMNVGILEQDLACGVDKDGKEVSASKLLTMLSNHLSDANAE
uniref:Sec1 family protein n=1 Tax=Toxoplasma gondii TgCATBr9 TaxID=943120 RepID=A0A2T6IEB3_TOXGO|nr:Sec1 family protein [Toxoplasma gondii TgCATBr9]